MPLDRAHITVASAVTLPTYAVGFGLIGANYLLEPPRLLNSPGLAYANGFMPLPAWGALYVTCSLIMFGALLTQRRGPFTYALWVCVVAEGIWSLCLFVGIFDGGLSATAWTRDAMIALFCWASFRSLNKREV